MTPHRWLSLLGLALTLVVLPGPGRAGAAAPKAARRHYVVALYINNGREYEAQIKTMLGHLLAKIQAQPLPFSLSLKHYPDTKTLFAALGREEPSFLYTNEAEPSLLAKDTGHYTVLASHTFMEKKEWPACLMVPMKSSIKTLADLKNKRAMLATPFFQFLQLAQLVGQPPTQFFSQLKPSPNQLSILYALSLGEADVGFLSQDTVMFLKKTNPGPVKNLRTLACGKPQPTAPLMASRRVPVAHQRAMANLLFAAHHDRRFAQYHALMKLVGLRFVPADEKRYVEVWKTLRSQQQTAIGADWRQWLLYVGNKRGQ